MAKEKVIRNNPNIRTNFNFPSFGFNSPGSLSRIKSRRGIQPELVDQTKGLINNPKESTANVASVASLLNLPILENAERPYADSSLQAIANNFAREELDMEQTEALMKIQNQQRLAARNKGIGQMLFALSDALGGRDVVGRLLERRAAMQPEEKSASKIRDELIRKIQSEKKLTADELITLKVIDPELAERLQFDPELTQAITTAISTQPNIPTITTKEQFDDLPSGASFYFNGNLEDKE